MSSHQNNTHAHHNIYATWNPYVPSAGARPPLGPLSSASQFASQHQHASQVIQHQGPIPMPARHYSADQYQHLRHPLPQRSDVRRVATVQEPAPAHHWVATQQSVPVHPQATVGYPSQGSQYWDQLSELRPEDPIVDVMANTTTHSQDPRISSDLVGYAFVIVSHPLLPYILRFSNYHLNSQRYFTLSGILSDTSAYVGGKLKSEEIRRAQQLLDSTYYPKGPYSHLIKDRCRHIDSRYTGLKLLGPYRKFNRLQMVSVLAGNGAHYILDLRDAAGQAWGPDPQSL